MPIIQRIAGGVFALALVGSIAWPSNARAELTVTVSKPSVPAKATTDLFDNEAAIPNGTPCPGERGVQGVSYAARLDVTPLMRRDFAAATTRTTARAFLFTFRSGPNRVLVRNDEPVDTALRSRLHEFGATVAPDGQIPDCSNLGGVYLIVLEVASGAVRVVPIGLAPDAAASLH